MKKPITRAWAAITTLVLALVGVVALNVHVPAAKALDGSMFDPGLIISDSVFYDFGATDAATIQKFLQQQVPKCKLAPAVNSNDFTCLRYYLTDIPAMPASAGRCNAIAPQTKVLASVMIDVIAKACNINPRVLLVTLQKEQGLVTSTNPYWPDPKNPGQPNPNKPRDYRYQIATGFSCTDTGPCTTFGFFMQVYLAGSQFHWYSNPAGSFTTLKVGKNITIHYQVPQVAGCGTRTFLLKSQATAALYYYTPYTPNQAALDNLYGTGDKCSAYGNRNFWRYYWDWFGSPIGGGFLLHSDTSPTYLIVPNTVTGGFSKYSFASPEVADSFAPLGPVGIVSQTYLDSFPNGGSISRLVVSATGQYYFVDAGQKHPLSSCDQAVTLGLSCADAVKLTSFQLNALATSAPVTTLVSDDPTNSNSAQYLITDGVKHQILDADSVAAAGIKLPALSGVGIDAFAGLPWGSPIATDGTLFKNSSSGVVGVVSGGKYFQFDPATSDEVDLAKWYGLSTGTLSDDGLSSLPLVQAKTIVADGSGKQWVLSSAGRIGVDDGSQLAKTAAILPTAMLTKIPVAATKLSTPFLAKATGSTTVYWVAATKRRPVVSTASRTKLSSIASQATVQVLPPSAIAQMDVSDPIVAPGTYAADSAGRLLLIDGFSSYATVGNADWAKAYGLLGQPEKLTKAMLKGYTSEGPVGLKIMCAATEYLPISGTWQPIDTAYSASYPGLSLVLDANTCDSLRLGNQQLGRIVISPAKLYYLVSNGKRRLITKKHYAEIRGGSPAAFAIDATLANALPLGKPMPAGYKKPIVIPSPTPTPSVTPSVTPSATPTATPTKTPKPTPKPTPIPTGKSYVVVSGDTLTTIAKKFGVTVAALKSKNALTSDLIKVGQKLTIP
jgi:hypothetical protein